MGGGVRLWVSVKRVESVISVKNRMNRSTNLVLTLDLLESNMVFDSSLRTLQGGQPHLPEVVRALKHLPPS